MCTQFWVIKIYIASEIDWTKRIAASFIYFIAFLTFEMSEIICCNLVTFKIIIFYGE